MTEGTQPHASFVESIPQKYDEHLGPVFFEPHARDVVERLAPTLRHGRLLELAAGTGIVTRKLRDALPVDVDIVGTDLNQAMIDFARAKFQPDEGVTWSQADATSLPFPDATFDAVVCQFGFMFFPDKDAAFRECFRVLKPEGQLLFNVWGPLAQNELGGIAHALTTAQFPDDPPSFYLTPFGFNDVGRIESMMTGAGFADVSHAEIALPGESPSARSAATGLIEGTPVSLEIRARDPAAVSTLVDDVERALVERYGSGPIRPKMNAIVFTARRPAASEDTIEPEELARLRSSEDPVIVDVRRSSDLQADPVAIEGALRGDPQNIDEWASSLPKDRDVFVYCVRGGSVSQAVVPALRERGIRARYVRGGIEAWKRSGGKTIPTQ